MNMTRFQSVKHQTLAALAMANDPEARILDILGIPSDAFAKASDRSCAALSVYCLLFIAMFSKSGAQVTAVVPMLYPLPLPCGRFVWVSEVVQNEAACLKARMKLVCAERHDRGAPTTNQDARYYAWNNAIWRPALLS